MSSARYVKILRALHSAVFSSQLSVSELRALSDELRRGRLADELAYMIERALEHFDAHRFGDVEDERVAHAQSLVRHAKISKTALASIMKSLGGASSSRKGTIREMLEDFVAESSESRVTKLIDLLASKSGGDDFLAGIHAERD